MSSASAVVISSHPFGLSLGSSGLFVCIGIAFFLYVVLSVILGAAIGTVLGWADTSTPDIPGSMPYHPEYPVGIWCAEDCHQTCQGFAILAPLIGGMYHQCGCLCHYNQKEHDDD